MADEEPKKIIKKIFKKGGHGHHGGAWKIAYADFVTAMMAFFLVMWLINSISTEQKKGIADYFTPNHTKILGTKPGNDGVLGGQALQGKLYAEKNNKSDKPSEEDAKKEAILLDTQKKVQDALESNVTLKSMSDQVQFEITPDGLNINIVDKEGRSMFPSGSTEMFDYMQGILKEVAKSISATTNKIMITGHTDAIAYTSTKKYTNWELSADRANATRRVLEENNIIPDRIEYVRGREARELIDKDPTAPQNRRITITLLK